MPKGLTTWSMHTGLSTTGNMVRISPFSASRMCSVLSNICEILYIYPIKLFLHVQGITSKTGRANVARFIPHLSSFFC